MPGRPLTRWGRRGREFGSFEPGACQDQAPDRAAELSTLPIRWAASGERGARDTISANDEDGNLGARDDPLGDAAEEQPLDPAHAASADHEDVGALRGVEQLLEGPPGPNLHPHPPPGPREPSPGGFELPARRRDTLLLELCRFTGHARSVRAQARAPSREAGRARRR